MEEDGDGNIFNDCALSKLGEWLSLRLFLLAGTDGGDGGEENGLEEGRFERNFLSAGLGWDLGSGGAILELGLAFGEGGDAAFKTEIAG